MKKISVIIPVYNVQNYLKRCIESVLQQTYNNIELILIDDGSTDSSLGICNYYKERYDNIMVLHQANKGEVAAVKLGLQHASGEYIGFIDSDDFIEPQMYAELLDLLLVRDVDFVHSEFYGSPKRTFDSEVVDIAQGRAAFINRFVLGLSTRITSSRCTNLYKSNLIKTTFCRMPDEQQWCEDLLSLLLCSLEANRVALTSAQYYHFVLRDNSYSHFARIELIKDTVSLYEHASCFLQTAGLYAETEICLKLYYLDTLRDCYSKLLVAAGCEPLPRYSFKKLNLENKKVILYGAGVIGRNFCSTTVSHETCSLVAWVDKNYSQINLPYYCVKSPLTIGSLKYDLILIAVASEQTALSIKKELEDLYGCPADRIVWVEPHDVVIDMIPEAACRGGDNSIV